MPDTLRKAIGKQVEDDPMQTESVYDTWRAFCEKTYGVTPPLWTKDPMMEQPPNPPKAG